MKIQQIGTMTGRAANLLAKILGWAPLLQAVEFREDPSYFANIPDKATFTSSAARAENAAAQKDNQAPNPTGVSLALYSREVGIDNVRVADAQLAGSPTGLRNYADRVLSQLAKKLAREIQDDIVAGTNSSYKMLGLSYFAKDAAAGGQTAALGFTQAEQAAMNSNISLKIDNVTDQNTFVELLMAAIAAVPGANAILVNTSLQARLTSIGQRIGAAGVTLNDFGRPVSTFYNVPVIPVPTTTILQTESDGTNSDCTSLYVVRFAEEQGVCVATNSGFRFQDFQDYQTYPQGNARLEFFLNLVVEATDAMLRLSRIRL